MPTPLPYAWPCNLINHMPRKDQVTLTLPGHRHRHCNRWTRRASSLTTIRTSEIIPVELNSSCTATSAPRMVASNGPSHGHSWRPERKSPSTQAIAKHRGRPRRRRHAAGMSADVDGERLLARLDPSAQPTASRWHRRARPHMSKGASLSRRHGLSTHSQRAASAGRCISTTLEPTGQRNGRTRGLLQMLIEGVADCGAPGAPPWQSLRGGPQTCSAGDAIT